MLSDIEGMIRDEGCVTRQARCVRRVPAAARGTLRPLETGYSRVLARLTAYSAYGGPNARRRILKKQRIAAFGRLTPLIFLESNVSEKKLG